MPWFDFAICLMLGYFGVHKFMNGDKKMGLIYLFTFGLFGIGWMIDCVMYFINAMSGKRSIGFEAKYKQLSDSDPLPVVQSSGVLLTAGEICYYSESATHLKTKNVVVGYTGGSRGVSIRVMKGMSYRVGAQKSQPIRGNVEERFPGVLTITNKRIIFSGAKGAFDKKLTQLSSITPHSDGVSFQFGDKQYPLMLKEPVYVAQLLARVVNTTEL